MPRPRKIKFPIGLEELLRLALPDKRREDRLKYYRLDLRADLKWKWNRPPTEEEVDLAMAASRTKRFSEGMSSALCTTLRHWVSIYETEIRPNIRRNRAKIAAAKRWSKENRKNKNST
jgi:hypothetical protein